MIDGHVHLENGPLTKEYVYEFINEAINKGIDELQILDHTHRFKEFAPLYEKLRFIKPQEEWLSHDLRDSIYDYIKLIEEMKKEKLPIKVSFGLEVCYQIEEEDLIKKLLSVYSWDFIVGSVHAVYYIAYDSSWSLDELWHKYDKNDIYREYFKIMFKLVESNIFTQLAHPDTIKMFNIYPDYDLTETYNDLAKLCNKHNIKVENNVGCYYRYHHQDKGLADDVLKIFKDNHCKMITVSDAHYPKDVGNYIKYIWDKTMN